MPLNSNPTVNSFFLDGQTVKFAHSYLNQANLLTPYRMHTKKELRSLLLPQHQIVKGSLGAEMMGN